MLVHQQNMLQDGVRTGTYRNAIIQNAGDFAGKVVLDVGTGTGILAFFAVQAGARKVYAVEASGIAAFARKLVSKNGMAHRIEVIEGERHPARARKPREPGVRRPQPRGR